MPEFITETRTVYHCPWCGKPYLRKQDVNYHINMKCRKNPEHAHPCFWCEHLEKADYALVFYAGWPIGEEPVRTVSSFHCKKHDTWMYSALAQKHHHPCVDDDAHILMPLQCDDFIYHDWKGNTVPWNLETFIGKSWQQKKQDEKTK